MMAKEKLFEAVDAAKLSLNSRNTFDKLQQVN